MNLEEQSLRIIKSLYDERKENINAFSGGKDSIVLKHLLKLSGLKFKHIYCNTTIDYPKHISFIKTNFPDVEIAQPKYSFYELIERKGLPTRQRRFCCQYLKEYIGKGCKVFEGVRIEEGRKRGKRLSALKEPEVCDTRVKGKIHVYPIMNWKETDIWNYIRQNNLIYPDIYDKGFTRLGCIGCPLANQKNRIWEYKMFPRYVYAIIKAINKNIQNGNCLSKFFDDPYEAFAWWMSEQSIEIFKMKTFFKPDYEEEIKKMYPLNR